MKQFIALAACLFAAATVSAAPQQFHARTRLDGRFSPLLEIKPPAESMSSRENAPLRRTLSLDGVWQIAEGTMETVPTDFSRTVPVPGLVDMAQPAFVEPGPLVKTPKAMSQKDPRRDAFWYRRSFVVDGAVPASAVLKIGKAMYGTQVFLNGKLLGTHLPCFTPGIFDARGLLRRGVNEITVRIGADRDAVGRAYPDGYDIEKTRYIPGLFDSVELSLSGTPHIANIQVAPDLAASQAAVRVYLDGTEETPVEVEIREAKSGKVVGLARARAKAGQKEITVAAPVAGCRQWTVDVPFLYEATARTKGDEMKARFGMRSFRFNPATRRAELNGKEVYLRGSNLCVFRFFEDAQRGSLVWDEAWVRTLYRRMKDMHWNSFRFSICQPPEMWYRIADEEGLLVQDEFPIWFGAYKEWGFGPWPKDLTTGEMVREYTEWMQDHWNHPSVVIWDACNETLTDRTAPAIAAVRGLDLSARPWENSYNPATLPAGDAMEIHPYFFMTVGFKLSQIPARAERVIKASTLAKLDFSRPLLINEYAWLWLNRDGSPTSLTGGQYNALLGANSTVSQRRHLYATYTAAETEYWRHWRKAAAVQHFVALTCDRPNLGALSGQTGDPWQNIQKLTWEPEFRNYVRDAFAPVGVMVDEWEPVFPPSERHDVPVSLINDTDTLWTGRVRLRILCGNEVIADCNQAAEVAPMGSGRLTFSVTIPKNPGVYEFQGTLMDTPVGQVSSWRTFTVAEGLANAPKPASGAPAGASPLGAAKESEIPPSPAAAH